MAGLTQQFDSNIVPSGYKPDYFSVGCYCYPTQQKGIKDIILLLGYTSYIWTSKMNETDIIRLIQIISSPIKW